VDLLVRIAEIDEEINIPTIRQILTQYYPNPGKFEVHYKAMRSKADYRDLFVTFIHLREKLLDILENTPDVNWNRPVNLTHYGNLSLLAYCNRIARQDKNILNKLIYSFPGVISPKP